MIDAASVIALFAQHQKRIALAESCTGGLIAASLTDIPNSSLVFERGFVTYSNESKMDLLDVPPALFHKQGAVSPEVASAMALGALSYSAADIALAVTGIAGPGGGSEQKPVGLVYFGTARRGALPLATRCLFTGTRQEIREAARQRGLELLVQALGKLVSAV